MVIAENLKLIRPKHPPSGDKAICRAVLGRLGVLNGEAAKSPEALLLGASLDVVKMCYHVGNPRLMLVPMMNVGQMGVSVSHRRMRMCMGMRFGPFSAIVLVLVMFVVIMPMAVHHIIMCVFVLMLFGKY